MLKYTILALLLVSVMFASTEAAPYTVDDDWAGADYDNIQDAIDASGVNQTIYVHEGNYTGGINVTQSVNIVGNGSSYVYIMNNVTDSAIRISADYVNISGMTITSNVTMNSSEAGIFIWKSEHAGIDNVEIYEVPIGIYGGNAHGADVGFAYVHNCTDDGIHFENSDDVVIYATNSSENERSGVLVQDSDLVTMESCELHDNNNESSGSNAGILADNSTNVTLLWCNITDTIWAGAWFDGCLWVNVTNCMISNTGYGIRFDDPGYDHTNSTIETNEITECTFGIYLASGNNSVLDNTLDSDNTGIYILAYTDTNLVRGNRIHNGSYLGISVHGEDHIIESNICNDSLIGIYLYTLSSNNTVSSNICGRNSIGGIMCVQTHWNTIFDNVCHLNDAGLNFSQAENNTVYNNTCIGNTYGFYVSAGHNTTMYNNTVNASKREGVYIDGSNDCQFSNNTVRNSSWDGIHLYNCENSTVVFNEIWFNEDSGVYVNGGYNNVLHHNNFRDNSPGEPQANDQGFNTTWDNGTHGNWWSDYNGTDGNGDGIGDTPYELYGTDAEDSYPLMDPVETGAPEKIPEAGIFAMVSMVLVLAIAFRRRRK